MKSVPPDLRGIPPAYGFVDPMSDIVNELKFFEMPKNAEQTAPVPASYARTIQIGVRFMEKFLCVFLCLSLMLGILPAFASGVSTSATRLVKVQLGELVTDCESASNGFVKCTFDGQTGYILAKYLQTTSEPADAIVLPNQQVTKCNSWVSLRKYADTSSERLAKIPLGATVRSCVAAGKFVKCTYGGKTGYVLAGYLKNASSSSASSEDLIGEARVVNCASFVSLRATPDTSAKRLDKVPLGAYVIAKGSASNGFVKAEYKGQTGYILAKYLTKY